MAYDAVVLKWKTSMAGDAQTSTAVLTKAESHGFCSALCVDDGAEPIGDFD